MTPTWAGREKRHPRREALFFLGEFWRGTPYSRFGEVASGVLSGSRVTVMSKLLGRGFEVVFVLQPRKEPNRAPYMMTMVLHNGQQVGLVQDLVISPAATHDPTTDTSYVKLSFGALIGAGTIHTMTEEELRVNVQELRAAPQS